MARARSITFNISTTADFAQLEGLKTALNEVSHAVDSLTRNMKDFNNSMKSIKSNYDNAAKAVDKVRTATVKFSASLDNASKTQARYDALTKRRVALNRELQNQTTALTNARNKLTQAENNLAKAKDSGDVNQMKAALQTYKEARREFETTAAAATKTGQAVDKLTAEQKQLGDEVARSKNTASGLFDSMSKEAQQASGPLKNLINTFTGVQNKIKGTIGTVTRMSEQVQKNNRIMADVNVGRGDPLVKGVQDKITALEKLQAVQKKTMADEHAEALKMNAAYDKQVAQIQKVQQAQEKLDEEMRVSQIRANRQVMAEQAQRSQQAIEALQNKVKGLASATAGAFRSFAAAGANAFSKFGGMLMNGQNAVTRFTKAVTNGMQSAQRAMTQFYNSGWSFITSGYIFQNFGQNLARSLTGGIQEYTQYERDAARAAIAASLPDISKIQDMVFGLQRGQFGGQPLMSMGADEISQGLYYYISAIGANLEIASDEALGQLGSVVGNIMQMAAATQTDVQTATKGVLNAVMEFGVNPRDIENRDVQDTMKKVSAQFGYLANLTTLEVPDIAEAFKMVGPLAHALSGNTPGAGLNETMALIATASDVGLRGGNVGRGINQLFQSLLSPTKPAIAAFAEAFGQEASKDAWNAFFFDSEGQLKDGIPGLFSQLSKLNEHQIADIFTNNAARVVTGVREAAEATGLTIEEYMQKISGPDAERWLLQATKVTNQTISANLQNLKNALFQFRAAIMETIGDPLKKALAGIAEAFYTLGDIIEKNPWMGKLIAGAVALVAAISTLIGTLFMAGGSILLMLKAFAALGSMFGPLVLLFSAFTAGMIILVPLLAAVGGAILYIRDNFEYLSGVMGTFFGFNPIVFFNNLRDGIESSVGDVPSMLEKALGAAMAVVQNTGDAIVQWAIQNRTAILSIVEAAKELGRGFAEGFLVATAAVATFSKAMAGLSFDFGRGILETIRELVAHFTGLEKESISLSKILGTVLGGAFALLVARHFIPSIAMTGALRVALLGLRAVMLATSAASFVIAGAFKVFGATLAIVEALIGAVSTVFTALTAGEAANAATKGILAAATTVLTAALGGEVAMSSLLVAVLALLAAAYLAVMGSLAIALVAIVAYTAATEGLTAGLEAAKQGALGIAEGFWLVVEPIVKIVAGLAILTAHLLGFVQASTSAHTIGVALGVMLGGLVVAVAALTAALTALGAIIAAVVVIAILQWIAAMIAANLPLLALIAVITLILGVLSELLGFDGVFDMLGSGFNYVADAAEWAYGKIKAVADAVKGFFTDTQEEVITLRMNTRQNEIDDLLKNVNEEATRQWQDVADRQGGFASSAESKRVYDEFYNKAFNDLYQGPMGSIMAAQAADQRALDEIRNGSPSSRYGTDVTGDGSAPTWDKPEQTKKGIMDRINDFFKSFGFDPKDPVGSITKMMGLGTLDQFTTGMQDFDLASLGGDPKMQKYLEDTKLYGDYIQDITKAAAQISASRKAAGLTPLDKKTLEAVAKSQVQMQYQMQGIPIPVEPVLPDGALDDVDEQLSKQKFEIELTAAMAKGADLPTTLAMAYGPNSAASGIMQYSDQIIKNLGDNAPWMNPTELLADAAISGNLGQNLAGVNIQKELEPFLRTTSEQTGVAISDMIKDIPRFVAPDALVNMATTELIQGLDTMPEEIGKRLDLLGTDVKDRWGNFVAENGFNWAELATYAASQGTEEDWNLIDYAMSAWDMTRDQAEAYFKSHGVDPNIINGALFGDTQMMANMADGAVAVVDESFFKWAQSIDENQDKVLEITQAGFDALPLAVKIGLTNMGYSFVVGGEETAGQIDQTNQMLADRLENTYKIFDKEGKEVGQKASQTFWDNLWANLGDDGIINAGWSRVDDIATGMTTITDQFGTTITIPTLEINGADEYAAQLQKLEDDLARWRTRRDKLKQEIADLNVDLGSPNVGYAAPQYSPTGIGFQDATGNTAPLTESQLAPAIELEIQVKQESLDRTRKAINQALGIGSENASVNTLEIEGVNISATGIDTFKTAITTATSEGVSQSMQTVAVDAAPFVSQFTAIGESAAAEFLRAFNSAVSVANLRTAGGSQSSDGQIYSDAGTTPQVATSNQTVEVSYTADTSAFDAAVTALQNTLGTLTRTTYMTHVTLDHVNLDTELTGVNTALQTFADTTFNATVGIDSVQMYGELYGVNNALDLYDARVVNATVGIVDFASAALQNIINKLDQINGRVVSYTVQPTGTAPPGTGPLPFAAGGVTKSALQLVGEKGPEIAALPQGTRIKSTAQTMNMLRGALQPDDNNVQLASIFRDISRETQGGDTIQNSGNTTVVIQNVNINNKQDAKVFFEELDQYQGRRNQLANRGMIPVTGESSI